MISKDNYELLLGKLAHELRNPLTTLSSTLQFIEYKHPEVKTFAHWDSVNHDVDFMCAILNDFSNLAASTRLHLTEFDLCPFFEQLVESFQSYLPNPNRQFTYKIAPTISKMTGDRTKLHEVFTNLLKNAFEATSSSGNVYFEVLSEQNQLQITLTDSGCGIEAEHLDTLFDPFITHKKNGTGLGLPVAKSILDSHHGTISLQSVPNVGTTFYILLPTHQ